MLALKLEAAQTDLIVKCKKAQLKKLKQEKKANKKKGLDGQVDGESKEEQRKASQLVMDSGISSGNPHQAQTLDEILRQGRAKKRKAGERRLHVLDPARGAAEMVGQGVGKLGRTVFGGSKRIGGDGPAPHRDPEPETTAPNGGESTTGDDSHPVAESVDGNTTSPANELTDSGPSNDIGRESHAIPKRPFWKRRVSSYSRRNGTPEADEYPLTGSDEADEQHHGRKDNKEKRPSLKEGDKVKGQEYPVAYNMDFESEDLGQPEWMKYIREKDRDTMRLPLFGLSWMPSLWLIGKKVDTIDHCRKEVARLNLEIEVDQQHPEKFPLMNSAFIQFNHQVAAHMACQAVSHHLPKHMEPRVVEISPDDVIWDNMSINWWERYLRTFGILTLVIGMVIG